MKALAAVIATLLGGGNGDVAIDRGALDGLDHGDRGTVYYTLVVRGDEKRIDVGTGEVVDLGDRESRIRLSVRRAVSAGYRIRFDVPEGRHSPTRLLGIARERHAGGDIEGALPYLDRIRDRLGDDPFIRDQIRELEADLQARNRSLEAKENLEYFLAAATHYLERDDLDMAVSYLDRAEALAPDDADLARLRGDVEGRREAARRAIAFAGMAQLGAGSYTIGLDIAEADYFNQQPRHQVRLDDLWIDREPVAITDFRDWRPGARPPREGIPPHMTGVSYEDASAYCRSRDKRLPSEQEWEAAASEGLLGSAPGLNEWTASWYLPYPGNDRPESSYGQTHRVLRRLVDESPRTLRRRRFLEPDQSHASVGFRCARDA
ncbi:MAG: SUMF1/EgtB/PvdO family nonheme iron enzyme [Thermoanaerobaculia bacterium]|nr:SUMF1/EgtB/PvdO family nonheme iron enzyme [Thermoanaerobaculia bacterium]